MLTSDLWENAVIPIIKKALRLNFGLTRVQFTGTNTDCLFYIYNILLRTDAVNGLHVRKYMLTVFSVSDFFGGKNTI